MQVSSARSGEQMMQRRGRQFIPSLFSMDPMSLITMNPFALMRRFSEEMDQIFSSLGMGGIEEPEPGAGLLPGRAFAPAIEILDRPGELVVRADLPGVTPEDVRAEIRNGCLFLEGERRSEREEQTEGGFYRSERSYGRFRRTIPLPDDVRDENITATFAQGVLEIRIPRAERQQQSRRIAIQRGESAQGERGTGAEQGTSSPPVH
jgi:HSP20 family protein